MKYKLIYKMLNLDKCNESYQRRRMRMLFE